MICGYGRSLCNQYNRCDHNSWAALINTRDNDNLKNRQKPVTDRKNKTIVVNVTE